jgi:hypothetical protein
MLGVDVVTEQDARAARQQHAYYINALLITTHPGGFVELVVATG